MIQEPKCSQRGCKWFLGVLQPKGDESDERPICHAYPEGIPNEIAYGDDLHLIIRDDQDNDLTFGKND